jgi:hypothetical protein
MEQEHNYTDLLPGEMVLNPGGDFIQVPDGEPLKMHIASVKLIEAPNFDRTGTETKLVVNFELDEDIEGKGQIFTGWFRPSLNPKSNLAQLVVALFGELRSVDPAVDFPGKALRVVIENREKDGVVKQYPKSFLKPAKDQKDVDVTKSDDLPEVAIEDLIDQAKETKTETK